MQQFTDSIRKSLQEHNWFGALFITLALPDICGTICEPKSGVGDRYRNWFNSYLKERYAPDNMYESILRSSPDELKGCSDEEILKYKEMKPSTSFTAQACYKIRCSCLHAGVDFSKVQSVFFTPPDCSGAGSHMNMLNGVLQLNVGVFCEDMCVAVEKWLKDNESNEAVMKGVEELMQIQNTLMNGIAYIK